MEKMPHPELRASLPAHARTPPALRSRDHTGVVHEGGGRDMRSWRGCEGLTALLPLPHSPFLQLSLSLQDTWGRYPGGLPLSLRSGPEIQMGPFVVPAGAGQGINDESVRPPAALGELVVGSGGKKQTHTNGLPAVSLLNWRRGRQTRGT